MKAGLWRRLDALSRDLAPVALTVVLLLLCTLPLRVPAFNVLIPSLPLIAVFYWVLYRPDLMPAGAAFAIGLVEDGLSGTPIGVSAMVLTCVHAGVTVQRRFFAGKSFAIVWLGFAVVATLAFFLAWLLVCAYYGMRVNASGVILQAVVTIGCLPLVWRLLVRCHLAILRPA